VRHRFHSLRDEAQALMCRRDIGIKRDQHAIARIADRRRDVVRRRDRNEILLGIGQEEFAAENRRE
jgi:hypothetical protein